MRSPSDSRYLHQILRGCASAENEIGNLDDPLKIVRQIGRCRVVIAGSYHAAVFALSHKFEGLKAQFGNDRYVLRFDDYDFREKFAQTLDKAWATAGEAGPRLLEAAEEQVKARLAAYQRLYRQIKARRANTVWGVGGPEHSMQNMSERST
jgi:colanic acid/amylovoran biosynthesis protein